MSKLSLILSILFTTSAFSLSIISDLDDTVKITHVRDTSVAIRNALFKTHAFEPMPELLREMEHYTDELIFVSGSPKVLNRRIKSFIKKNDLNVSKVFTRGFRQLSNSYKFKIETLNRILQDSDEDYILIGDNTENDPHIYAEIKKMFPQRIKAIYIHNVHPEPSLPGQILFVTAFDIALSEYMAKRMTFEQASSIGQQVVVETNMSKIIPYFSLCPTDVADMNEVKLSKLTFLDIAVKTKIIGYCKTR